MGIRVHLSSGDADAPVAAFSERLGIEHAHARQPSAMAYAKALLRVVRNIAIFLFLVLFVYLAWYWPEIWVDAQAKHAQNMLDAATAKCSKEAHL